MLKVLGGTVAGLFVVSADFEVPEELYTSVDRWKTPDPKHEPRGYVEIHARVLAKTTESGGWTTVYQTGFLVDSLRD